MNSADEGTDSAGNFSAILLNALNRRPSEDGRGGRETLAPRLLEAMRYSALSGGKGVRPALVYAAAEAVGGGDAKELDDLACAVELIHAYSLIHDDLPSMDNDELRRGKPACHVAFGEGLAILAGDALQVRAFELLAQCESFRPQQKLRMIALLSGAIGVDGMAGGQALDLLARDAAPDLRELEKIHCAKTGSLICASVLLGAVARDADADQIRALREFGELIGLAFQVRDDLLDFGAQAGAAPGAPDAASYPALVGVEAARQKTRELHERALAALEYFGEAAAPLRSLAASMTALEPAE